MNDALAPGAAQGFYAVHRERPFFAGLVRFMTEGPIAVLALGFFFSASELV